MPISPPPSTWFALLSLLLALFCAVNIALDEWRHLPKMAVMAVVWPLIIHAR